MKPYIPTLLLRTRRATAAVELNGILMGEATPDEHIVLPLAGSGEYYVGVYPLRDEGCRMYPVVRKLRFENGAPLPVDAGDVALYAWPGSVFEAVLSPGALPEETPAVFPYTVDQLALPDGCVATLYYENGLRVAVEEGLQVRFGATLCEGRTGRLGLLPDGMLAVTAGEPRVSEGDLPADYGEMVLVLGTGYDELLRVAGDAAGVNKDAVNVFTRLPTLLGHERKEVWRYGAEGFAKEEPAVGFFTHSPVRPAQGRGVIRAFCEAVQLGLWEEAVSYLSDTLREGLLPGTMREFFGDFTGCRAPFSRHDGAIGLTYPPLDGIIPVRVFSFAFDGGRIDNISED